jgi:DNA polymerase I-like protein with 3'-5' exonuclease and polymerase domains
MTSHLVTVVHDELVFDVADAEFHELVEAVPVWMDYPLISRVLPVTVSLEYSGTNWADKKGLDG